MDSKSLPVGVLEYCCIHQQQMDELSWRQPTVYLWMQLGCIDEALVVMVLCTGKNVLVSAMPTRKTDRKTDRFSIAYLPWNKSNS